MSLRFTNRLITNALSPSRCRHRLAGTALLASLLFCPARTSSQQARPTEYQVKAVYLYNFSRFVEWPARRISASGNSFTICVLGKDPFGSALDTTVAGESIAGRRVVVRRTSKPQDALDCQIVFVSASEDKQLKEDLAALTGGVLTVSDIPGFSERGGMIQFVAEGGKIRFEVNLSNAKDSGLVLSSDLLKVAVAVRKNARHES